MRIEKEFEFRLLTPNEVQGEIKKIYKIYNVISKGEGDTITISIQQMTIRAISNHGDWIANTFDGERKRKLRRFWEIVKDFNWDTLRLSPRRMDYKVSKERVKKIKRIRKRLVEEFKPELVEHDI